MQVRNSTIKLNSTKCYDWDIFNTISELWNRRQGASHKCVPYAVTETALAADAAGLKRQEQGVRKPSTLPVKAHRPAQVSSPYRLNPDTALIVAKL